MNCLCIVIAERPVLLKLERLLTIILTIIYLCPMEQTNTYMPNTVNFIILYFEDAPPNKKSTFPNVRNKKNPNTLTHKRTEKKLTKKERVTLSCFYKPHVEMTEFP